MAFITVIGQGNGRIDIQGRDRENDSQPFVFDSVVIKKDVVTSALKLSEPISIDADVAKVLFDGTRLKTFEAIKRDANSTALARLADLREDLSRRTVRIEDDRRISFFSGGNEFEVNNDSVSELSFHLPFLEPEGADRPARFSAKLQIKAKLDADLKDFAVKTNADAEIEFEVHITADPNAVLQDFKLDFRALSDELDGVIADLPDIDFSSLSLDGLLLPDFNEAFKKFLPASLPVPEVLKDIEVTSAITDPQVTVTIGSGALALSLKASSVVSTVRYDGTELLKVTVDNFAMDITGKGAVKMAGEVTVAVADAEADREIIVSPDAFPLKITLTFGGVKDVSWDSASKAFEATWIFKKISIELKEDPANRIDFRLNLKTRYVNERTEVDFFDFQLLNLSAAVDLEAPGFRFPNLVPFVIRFDPHALDDMKEFLRRLQRMLGAVLRYLAKGAEAVGTLLSKLAEATAEVLARLIEALADMVQKARGHVVLAISLEARSFKPVQIALTTAHKAADEPEEQAFDGSFFKLKLAGKPRPALVYDLRNDWVGLVLLHDKAQPSRATLETDLWLSPKGSTTQSVGNLSDDDKADPLLSITAQAIAKQPDIVLAALKNGQGSFFQKTEGAARTANVGGTIVRLLTKPSGLADLSAEDITLTVDYDGLQDKVLSLLPSAPASGGGGFLDSLSQKVKLKKGEGDPEFKDGVLCIPFQIEITVTLPGGTNGSGAEDEFKVEADLVVQIDTRTLQARLDGDEVEIKIAEAFKEYNAFGLKLKIWRNDNKAIFVLNFGDGNLRLDLAEKARMEVIYDRLSTSGRGLVLKAERFGIGHGGLDLTAVFTDEPVRLAGVDQSFRFKSGSIRIEGGTLIGGTLSGSGPLPPALVGEAVAEIDLTFGNQNGRLKVISADATLSNAGAPLYSTGTRFRFDLDQIKLAYRDVDSGGEHFFFMLWGKAAFEPGPDEFTSGILTNLKSVAITLEGAPLTGDASELLKHIGFLVELDPPIQENLFDVFGFEIRGIALYPQSDKWRDKPPAIGIAGQISFMKAGDVIRSEIDCHELLLTYGDPEKNSALPRLRADGLSVLLEVNGLARVEATAVAVDGNLPSIYTPVEMPADVTADGFLAAGRVEIKGLGAYGGAMGFLELGKEGVSRRKHAMFLYVQAEKLAERIDTPVGPLWIREAGAGLGVNYTLSAIAAADQAESPRELVRSLDEISKLQGNLSNFNAWTPQYDKDALTFALRGMISMTSGSQSSSAYNEKAEKNLANPLLIDVVLALRTDLTFFANLRGWLTTNYHDWFSAPATASWKEKPTLRGYLYFSVPRREFLARAIADGSGVVGKHPELDKSLVKALEASRFASTLYIRPGLYHMEMGWPYEIGFNLGEPGKKFWLSVSGGTIVRIEDATALFGIAFRASGGMYFEGRAGGSSFGAAVSAVASFALGAKFIAYIEPLDPKETLFYGDIFLNISIDFGVSVWLSFKIFRKRITLRIGFSIMLTVSVAAEVVLSGQGVGARVQATVGVRGFGRTIAIGIGFAFGDGHLERARARVARFMTLGLGVDIPKGDTLHTPPPAPEPARGPRTQLADERLDRSTPLPRPPLPEEDEAVEAASDRVAGHFVGKSDFWAMLIDAGEHDLAAHGMGGGTEKLYILQLLPKDLSELKPGDVDKKTPQNISTFFTEPFNFIPGRLFGTDERPDIFADYEISVANGGTLPKHRLKKNGLEAITENTVKIRAELGQMLGDAVDINALLADCFLAGPGGQDGDSRPNNLEKPEDSLVPPGHIGVAKNAISFGEPDPILFLNPTAPSSTPAVDALNAQRSRDDGALGPDAANKETRVASFDVNERRSAVINKVGETLRQLGDTARTPGFNKEGWDRSEKQDIDARDFGLTFVIRESEIASLFEDFNKDQPEQPLEGKFNIKKRVWRKDGSGGQGWDWSDEGKIELLRHPDASFENRQPRLEKPRAIATTDGLALFWDLEPAFANASSGDGFEFVADPETHLDYYEIERSFEGTDFKWTHTFQSRTTTRLDFGDEKGTAQVKRERATMHLCDDLSEGGITEDFRALLLGTPIPSGRTARDVWKTTVLDTRKVKVIYKITAVDEMGTRTSQRVLEYDVPRPAAVVPAPLASSLTATFAGGMPTRTTSPKVAMRIDLADKDQEQDALAATYRIRIRSSELKGGGLYGVDAVDDAKSRPSNSEINVKRVGDIDLRLKHFINDPTNGIPIRVYAGDELLGPDTPPSFKAVDEEGAPLAGNTLNRLLEALGNEAGMTARKARRVFLRREEADPRDQDEQVYSAWGIVETQLRVLPDEDTDADQRGIYNNVVELYEKPLDLQFETLNRTQLQRKAGRLELQYPARGSDLGALVGDKSDAVNSKVAVTRHLDPDRRSAIQLDINIRPKVATTDGSEASTTLVGGFDIFTLDPARLRLTDDLPDFDGPIHPHTIDTEVAAGHAARAARRRASVKILPRSLAGLFPEAVPDFQTIEARYPSGTMRTDPLRQGKRKRGTWYSASESLLAFPAARLRRSLFPTPDETLISSLLDGRNIKDIVIQIEAPNAPKYLAPAGMQWGNIRGVKVVDQSEGGGSILAKFQISLDTEEEDSAEDRRTGLRARHLRAFLRELRFGNDGKTAERQSADRGYADWRRTLTADKLSVPSGGTLSRINTEIAGFDLQVTLSATAEGYEEKRTEIRTVNLHSELHPVLEETLAQLVYEEQKAGDEHPGAIYRAYEVVREARTPVEVSAENGPPKDAKKLEKFTDQFAPATDPYGWGALRALGLAEGFRLYDMNAGQYLSGKALLKRVNKAFGKAIEIYHLPGIPDDFERALTSGHNLGAPMVDLVDQADRFMSISSYSGRNERTSDDTGAILEGNSAIVQISLRPRPAQSLLVRARDFPHTSNPYPVRYYLLKGTKKGNIQQGKLQLREGYVVDLKLRAGISPRTGMRRWANERTAEWIFENPPEGMPTDFVFRNFDIASVISEEELAAIAAAGPEDIVGYLRVTGIGTRGDGENRIPGQVSEELWRSIEGELNKEFDGLVSLTLSETPKAIGDTSEQPDFAEDLFDRFPPLDGDLLGMLELGKKRRPQGAPAGISPYETFLQHLPAGLAPPDMRWPTGGEATSGRKGAGDRLNNHSAWCARFLDHGTARARTVPGMPPKIEFSLTSLTGEDGLARAPDATGVLSTFFIEPTQAGRELLFAVRPYSRYAGVEAQIDGTLRVAELTASALGKERWRRSFRHVALPRTRPAESPGILSVARTGDRDEQEIELVVARSKDQMTGLGNIPAERALQPGWSAVELRAGFPAHLRASHLMGAGFDWMDGLKPPSDAMGDVLEGKVVDGKVIYDMQRRVPDTWRGAIRFGLRGLPHFLRTTALAHQSAGVIVSGVTGMILPEAGFKLRPPPLKDVDAEAGDPRPPWGETAKPSWTLVRHTKGGEQVIRIHFDIPLTRNLDLIPDGELKALTGGDFRALGPVYHLPDAKASYRISSASADGSTLSGQIEILPTVFEEKSEQEAALYGVARSGQLFSQIAAVQKPRARGETDQPVDIGDRDAIRNWRLSFSADMPAKSPAARVKTEVADFALKCQGLLNFANPVGLDFDAGAWGAWAPRRKVVAHIPFDFRTNLGTLQQNIQQAEAHLSAFADDPGVQGLKGQWDLFLDPDAPTFPYPILMQGSYELSGTLPIGVSLPADAQFLLFTEEPHCERRDVFYKDLQVTLAMRAKTHSIIRAAYAGAQAEDAIEIFEAELDARRQALQPGFGYVGPVYAPSEGQVPHPGVAPFTGFQLRAYTLQGEHSSEAVEKALLALFEALRERAGERNDDVLVWRIDRTINEYFGRAQSADDPLPPIVVPVPAGAEPVDVEDWEEDRDGDNQPRGDFQYGFHQVPEFAEIGQLAGDVAEPFVALLERALFSEGGLKLSFFKGDARPVSVSVEARRSEP